jgi:hypothetical protein
MRVSLRRRALVALVIAFGAALMALADAGAPRAVSQELRPFGDDFNGRIFWYSDPYNGVDVFPRTERVSNRGATMEPGESAPCGPIGSTLWFEYPSDRQGLLQLSTEGSSIGTVLAVYEFDWTGAIVPSPPGAQLRTLACDSGNLAIPTEAEALLELPIDRGRQYLIQVGGIDGAQGDIVLHANCECGPPNDTMNWPGYLYVDPYTPTTRSVVNTTRATVDPGEPTSCGNMGATVWYSTTSSTSPRLDFDVSGSDFPAAVAVYAVDYNESIPYPPGGTLRQVGCSADGSTLTLSLDEFTEYWVQAGGVDGARGTLVVDMSCNPSCPPYNDNAGSAEWLEPPANYGANTDGATNEPSEPQACGGIDKTVWYLVIPRGDTRLTIDTEFSEFRTAIALYEVEGVSPPGGTFELLACDAASSAADAAEIEFDAKANVGYYLQVGGVDGASGLFSLNVDCEPSPCPPFNDSIRQPAGFSPPQPDPYTIMAGLDTRGATVEAGESTSCGNMGRTTWYQLSYYYEAPPTRMKLTTDGSDYDTAIAVYQAPMDVYTPEFSSLTPVACAAGAPGARASVSFTGGTMIWVQVGGRDGAGGSLTLNVECDPYCPPGNDNSTQAWSVSGGGLYEIDTRGATLETAEPQACGASSHTVWFRADGLGGGFELSFDATASNYTPVIAVYKVAGLSPQGGANETVACGTDSVEFSGAANTSYLIQVGDAAAAGGLLSATVRCEGAGCVVYPDHGGQGGGGPASGGGNVSPPDTGSGGYLPGARGD